MNDVHIGSMANCDRVLTGRRSQHVPTGRRVYVVSYPIAPPNGYHRQYQRRIHTVVIHGAGLAEAAET